MTLGTGPSGVYPREIALNPLTNKIYVADGLSITVIDGGSNTSTIIPVGDNGRPVALAVNPVTNKIYVAVENTFTEPLIVLDGYTNSIQPVVTGFFPKSVAVNPVTGRAYVIASDNSVNVIDGSVNLKLTMPVRGFAGNGVVDTIRNKIYVLNPFVGGSHLTVIDGTTNLMATLAVAGEPTQLAVNPVTGKVYVSSYQGNTVTVIDTATYSTATVSTGGSPWALAVNPVTNKLYAANEWDKSVTAIDLSSGSTATVPAGTIPAAVAVNPATNKIYVANTYGSFLTVVDGNSNSAVNLAPQGDFRRVAVNPVTNKIYAADYSGKSVTVIDGVSNALTTVATGDHPYSVAVNPATNKIYVAAQAATVIDGATNSSTLLSRGAGPAEIAINIITNKVYIANDVIDGGTGEITRVPAGTMPMAVAVNPVTNKIYVANRNSNNVTVIDGASNSTTTLPAEFDPYAVAVNPLTNKIYVACPGGSSGGRVAVIDGATNTTSTVTIGQGPVAFAVNPVTNKVYVASLGGLVTVIDESPVQQIPLASTISPMPNNTVASPTPSFTFTGTTTFSPNALVVQDVVYQVDTWQGQWKSTAPSFTAKVGPLLPGMHTLYAFAIDAQAATSTQPGSPLIGNIAAYHFLVVPASQSITFPSLTGHTYGDSLALSAATDSGLPVTFTSNTLSVCRLSGTTVALVGVGTCSITASQPGTVSYVAAPSVTQSFFVNGATLTVAATDATKTFGAPVPSFSAGISGFRNGDTAAVLTGSAAVSTTATTSSPVGTYPITVDAGTLAAANYTFSFQGATLTITPAVSSLAVTGLAPGPTAPPGQSFTLTFTVAGAAGAPPPGGVVVYSVDGGTPQNATITAGIATVTLAGLATGTHTLIANYAGDGNYLAAAPQTVTLTVGKLAALLSMAVSPANSLPIGQDFTLTFVLTPPAAGVPAATGTVSYSVDGGSPQTALLTAGRAAATLSGLVAGTHTVTTNYSGDANYLAAGPQSLNLTVILGTPVIPPGGLVSAGGFNALLSPGGLGAIFGTSLAGSAISVSSLPLPASLGGVQVLVNGVAAPLLYVSPTQINFQVPFEAPAGSAVTVQLVQNGKPGPAVTATFPPYAPAVFTYQRGPGQLDPVIVHTDNTLVTPDKPAKPSEVLTIYATGAGSLNNAPASGAAAPASPLATTKDTPTVTVGGASATVQFSGLTPGFVGLLQINIQLPATLPAGPSLPLVIAFPGASSAPVNLWVSK